MAGVAGVTNGITTGSTGTGTRADSVITAVNATATQQLMLSGPDPDHPVTWDFLCTHGRNSNVWSTIPTPSHWEFHGFGTYTTGWTLIPEEQGHYRHAFSAPAGWAGRRTFIVFEGSMTDTTVSINGRLAGPTHQGGFYRFRYDVTDLLAYGSQNLLEVTVLRDSTDDTVNQAEREGDYWNFGGIYRPVYLQSYPAEYVDRIAIDAKADGSFTVDAYLGAPTAGAPTAGAPTAGAPTAGATTTGATTAGATVTADRITATVRTLDNTTVGHTVSAPVPTGVPLVRLAGAVRDVQPWSAETPHLYLMDIRLYAGDRELHRTIERFGFRTMQERLGDGIYVNGRKIRFKGACRHTIWPDSGRATTPEISRNDVMLMKQMNMNAVRSSHYPPDPHFLDACDELGLYVIDELAGWQKAYSEEQAIPKVKSMVTRDVNHPSVLFWANGNEWGFQYAVDDDYAIYDPQQRPVIHPINADVEFNGIKTHHYDSYNATIADASGAAIFMPTEMLHGLYDGGAGSGLSDYWDIMADAPHSAGGFIWALLDEGIRRDDRGGAIDVNPNYYPDGILGPYRQKEASFYTIADVWSPIQLTDRRYFETIFPAGFTGAVRITNRHDFINTKKCRFAWQLVNFVGPGGTRTGHSIAARADIASPDIAPGGAGALQLRLPTSWRRSDALVLIAQDPSGREINRWTWTIAKAADHAERIVRPAPLASPVTATVAAAAITMRAGSTEVSIDPATGRLARVVVGGTPVSLANGPTLVTSPGAVSPVALEHLSHGPDGTAYAVAATYTGGLTSVLWRLHASGWLQLEYRYSLTGSHDFFGVSFDYPESKTTGVTWLGSGPYRVWKNRTRGLHTDVWSKAYNDTATGADTWQYPEFKGCHANTYWATLQTSETPITVVSQHDDLFLRLFTPRWGPNPMTATAPFPAGDISFLDAIPAMGTKFDPAVNLGPESQPAVATGEYHRTLFFRFG